MSEWTQGYNSEVGYTSSFYNVLTPQWLCTALLLSGHQAPDISADYTYCDLGCGQGFGSVLTAAANPKGRFVAIDFNPAQIAHAQDLARTSDVRNIEFLECSFDKLAEGGDPRMPPCDFMVLHGIYSWVSRTNQEMVVKILERYLKPGGVAFVSYNAHPGWASFQAAKKLIKLAADPLRETPSTSVEKGLTLLQSLQSAEARVFSAYPKLPTIIETLLKQDRGYLAHELLHEHWFIHHSADVAEDMSRAKLDFVTSAYLADNYPAVSLPPKVRALLEGVFDPRMAETIKDIARNQNFRRDIFVRGARKLLPADQRERLGRLKFALLRGLAPEEPIKFQTPMGEAVASNAAYRPIMDALQKENQSFDSLRTIPTWASMPPAEMAQGLALLMAGGYIHPVLVQASEDVSCAQQLNRVVVKQTLAGAPYGSLCAPSIGSGVNAGMMEMALLAAVLAAPRSSAQQLAQAAHDVLQARGSALASEVSVPVAENFLVHWAPYWRKLGVFK